MHLGARGLSYKKLLGDAFASTGRAHSQEM
jgi:hypothetical protein